MCRVAGAPPRILPPLALMLLAALQQVSTAGGERAGLRLFVPLRAAMPREGGGAGGRRGGVGGGRAGRMAALRGGGLGEGIEESGPAAGMPRGGSWPLVQSHLLVAAPPPGSAPQGARERGELMPGVGWEGERGPETREVMGAPIPPHSRERAGAAGRGEELAGTSALAGARELGPAAGAGGQTTGVGDGANIPPSVPRDEE